MVAPAQVRLTLIGVHTPGENACPGCIPISYRGHPLGGKVCRGRGGSCWSHPCVEVPDHHQHPSSPGSMDTNQGRAHLRRGNHSNPSPHNTPPRGGLLEFFPRPGHKFSHRGGTPGKILVRRVGWTPIRVGRTCAGATTATCHRTTSSLGGYPRIFFPRLGHKLSHKGEPLGKIGYTFNACIISNIECVPHSQYFHRCQRSPRQHGRC